MKGMLSAPGTLPRPFRGEAADERVCEPRDARGDSSQQRMRLEVSGSHSRIFDAVCTGAPFNDTLAAFLSTPEVEREAA
jgi:hypothetical protein